MELVINFAAPFQRQMEKGLVRQPMRMLVGQMERPVLIQPTGRVELLGTRFHPAGAYPFFRIPIHHFTGWMVGLDEVARPLDDEISTCVCPQPGVHEKVAAVETILAQKLSTFEEGDTGIEAAVRTILRREGSVRVEEVAQALGTSTRQLERRFLQRVGISPKLLARILRFQRVFRAVEREDANWAAVAVECGYYDSAHLIRDFREFSGPPGEPSPGRRIMCHQKTNDQAGLRWPGRLLMGATLLLVLGPVAAGSQVSGPGAPAQAPKISDLAWISGSWQMAAGPRRVEEHWTEAAGNAILGMGRTLSGDQMIFFEYLRIEARPDGIYYVAHPRARPGTDFKLTSFDGHQAVFENPGHDFPKRVLYRRNADGSLTARIDGGPGAEAKAEEFHYQTMSRK